MANTKGLGMCSQPYPESVLIDETRIPLERGRDIAMQYGVAPLLSPLFDFVPNTNAIGALPPGMPSMSGEGIFRRVDSCS